ncbi:MAG: alanine racemase [Alphaproteobacteria bacterium]
MTNDTTRFPGAVLTVNLDAVAANWRSLADRTAGAECGAVVKADGYGLGAARISNALRDAGCRRFFVATIDEAITLRASLPRTVDIYVLEGLMSCPSAAEFDAHALIPVLNTPDDVRNWADHAKRNDDRRAILSLDTGMCRLGLTPSEALTIAETPGALDGIELDYVMSHLACADEPGHPKNDRQRSLFEEIRAKLPPAKASFANSAGIFLGAEFHFDLARPGAALYGVSRGCGAPEPMNQVIGLKAKILQIRVVDTESTVGYGATRTVPANSRLATVAAGYADGYLRSLSNSGYGYAAGVKVPVAGRVSMDLTVFDISDVPPDAIGPGDNIDLICDRQTVDDVADAAGTIGYEILTSLGARYAKSYTGAAA